MARTLLIGGPDASWRELRKANPAAPWLCLDPSDPDNGLLGRAVLHPEDRKAWRFFGGLDPLRAPHVMVGIAAELMRSMPNEGFVQLFSVRAAPLVRETALWIARLVGPEKILVADADGLGLEGWPVGPEWVDAVRPYPWVVVEAQRKAHWLAVLEQCENHEFPLASVSVQGARLGSGEKLDVLELARCGVEAQWAERSAGTLFAVVEENPKDEATNRALNVFDCKRVVYAEPSAYIGLLCAFSRQSGEDFGFGVIDHIDFPAGMVYSRTTAVAPAPVRILKLGGLRLGKAGSELGELRPWQV